MTHNAVAVAGVDVHGHGIPARLLDDIRRDGTRLYAGMTVEDSPAGPVVFIPGLGNIRPMARAMLDFRDRLAWLDQRGIDKQIVSPWLDLQGYELPSQAFVHWAIAMNDAIADNCASSGGRLVGMSTLPVSDPKASVKELERAMRDLRLPAVMLSTDPGPVRLHDASLEEVWSAAEDLGAVIVLHPSLTGPASHIPNSADFGNLYWRGIDTMFAATRLILAGVFDRHPRLNVVLSHGGGFLPYQTARLDRSYFIDAIGPRTLQREKPSDYFADFYYDTCLLAAPALRLLRDLAGDARMVLGSDYPMPIGDPDPVGTVGAANWDEATTQRILRDTAVDLFRLPG
jgi:aminocarboxymuconate-semialdehyde decarboxylase